eukprot:3418806-Alexandrium_andersonii.AAC.1
MLERGASTWASRPSVRRRLARRPRGREVSGGLQGVAEFRQCPEPGSHQQGFLRAAVLAEADELRG